MTSSNSIKNSIDISGQRFNRLLAVRKTDKRVCKHVIWEFLCDCGKTHFAAATEAKRGQTTSCGCALIDFLTSTKATHGETRGGARTSLYTIWNAMLKRCSSPTCAEYKYYGGRGIRVCDQWHDFANFKSDMWPRPTGKSIDRIDNNGHYEPGNCRWATSKEQGANRRSTRRITIGKDTHCIAEWARISGTNPKTIWARLKVGRDPEYSVFAPTKN